MLATLLRLAESRSIPARAHDELVLHMQQRFAQDYSGLNVRSCRLASRSTSTRRRHAGLGARRLRRFTVQTLVAHKQSTAACFLTLKRRERLVITHIFFGLG